MVVKIHLSMTILSTRPLRVLSHATTKLMKYVIISLEKDTEIFRHLDIF